MNFPLFDHLIKHYCKSIENGNPITNAVGAGVFILLLSEYSVKRGQRQRPFSHVE